MSPNIEAAAKIIYDRDTDRRDPGHKPWHLASDEDRKPSIDLASRILNSR